MKILIVSGGKNPSFKLLNEEVKNCDYLICVDSGANCLYKYNIIPDLLLGDFDSINKEAFEYFKNSNCKIDVYPKEKDFTDSELALETAIKMGANSIIMLGFTGSRIDHLLGNLGLLIKCLNNNIEAYIKDDNNVITLINKPCKFSGNKGDIISFQAYSDVVKHLTIKGAKYPLNNYDLGLGESLTISNEFNGNDVEVLFDKGRLLVILAKD